MNQRQKIRYQARKQRRELTPRQRKHYTTHFLKQAKQSQTFINAKRIAFYLPNDGELNLTLLLKQAIKMKKHCYLPVIKKYPSRHLCFTHYRPGDPLKMNHFNIPEPISLKRNSIKAASLDLILMPLVAFDQQGHRIGMGGGYFDYTLQFLLNRKYWKKPKLIGTAYHFQEITHIESCPWDVSLDEIITDQHTFTL